MRTTLMRNAPWIVVLFLGLLIRFAFITVDFGAVGDLASFRAWGHSVYADGLAQIYRHPGVNYPPFAVFWFGAAAALQGQLPIAWSQQDAALTAFIKLPTALADIGIGLMLAFSYRERHARVLAAYVLNPAVWYVSAFWGQIDSVYVLFLTASVLLIERKRIVAGWLGLTLGTATKVLALPIAPTILVGTWLQCGARAVVRGLAAAFVLGVMLVTPWLLRGDIVGPVTGSFRVANSMPRLVMSGYNFWYLVRGSNVHEVTSLLHPVGLPFSYLEISLGLFALIQVAVIVTLWRAGQPPLALAAAVSCLSFFMFATEIHERYLLPTLGLVMLSARSRPRLWWLYAVLSASFLFNLVTIVSFTPLISNIVAAAPDTPLVKVLKLISLIVAAANTVAFLWLLAEFWRVSRRRETSAVATCGQDTDPIADKHRHCTESSIRNESKP